MDLRQGLTHSLACTESYLLEFHLLSACVLRTLDAANLFPVVHVLQDKVMYHAPVQLNPVGSICFWNLFVCHDLSFLT